MTVGQDQAPKTRVNEHLQVDIGSCVPGWSTDLLCRCLRPKVMLLMCRDARPENAAVGSPQKVTRLSLKAEKGHPEVERTCRRQVL